MFEKVFNEKLKYKYLKIMSSDFAHYCIKDVFYKVLIIFIHWINFLIMLISTLTVHIFDRGKFLKLEHELMDSIKYQSYKVPVGTY